MTVRWLKKLEYAEYKRELDTSFENVVVVAIELPNGKIITGRNSERMAAAPAAILNAVKNLAGMADPVHLIAPHVLKGIQDLKKDILKQEKTSLNVEEVLNALTVSASTNPSAELAVEKLKLLRGCKAHCTAILNDKDEQLFGDLGIDITCDPEFSTNNLYFK